MTPDQIYARVAASLREFGYDDTTAEMVADTHRAMVNGDGEMPHGIVGMFAQRQLDELTEAGAFSG